MEKKNKNNKFKNKTLVKGLFTMLITATLLLSVIPATAITTNHIEKNTDNSSNIVTAKAATIKITWNGNSGKIGGKTTKVTTVKKGSKIKKLPTTPKQLGYTFKGGYTKKTGGKKITVKTKPSKKVTYYAQWKKVLNSEEQTLVGSWGADLSDNGYKVLKGLEFGDKYPTWNSITRIITFRADEHMNLDNFHLRLVVGHISTQQILTPLLL